VKTPSFISLIRNADAVGANEISRLREFIEEYPYCQTARILYNGALAAAPELQSEKNTRLTALYAGDRKIFRQYMASRTAVTANAEATGASRGLFAESPLTLEEPSVFAPGIPDFLQAEEAGENILAAAKDDKEENPSETSVFIPADEIPETAPAIEPEVPSAQLVAEKETADPHEIIRRRLNEILSTRTDASQKPAEVKPQTAEPLIPASPLEMPGDLPSPPPATVELIAEQETAPVISSRNDTEEIIIRKK
jgi:hypothetical protein